MALNPCRCSFQTRKYLYASSRGRSDLDVQSRDWLRDGRRKSHPLEQDAKDGIPGRPAQEKEAERGFLQKSDLVRLKVTVVAFVHGVCESFLSLRLWPWGTLCQSEQMLSVDIPRLMEMLPRTVAPTRDDQQVRQIVNVEMFDLSMIEIDSFVPNSLGLSACGDNIRNRCLWGVVKAR